MGKVGEVEVLTYSPKLIKSKNCQRVLALSGGPPSITANTLNTIKKLFGFR